MTVQAGPCQKFQRLISSRCGTLNVLNRFVPPFSAGAGRFKRIRQEGSTDSENGINQQRKRIRQMSSDSDDDVVCLDAEDSAATLPLNRADSSATQPYSLDSQRSDATEIYSLGSPKKTMSSTLMESVVLTTDPEKLKKIEFLSNCFQGKTKLVLLLI